MASFYEFFAGGGMARAGLGDDWQCLLANDFDPKKAASYAANWGADHLRVGDVAALTTADLPGAAACGRALNRVRPGRRERLRQQRRWQSRYGRQAVAQAGKGGYPDGSANPRARRFG